MTFAKELKEQWPLILVLFLMQVFAFGFPTFALPFVYSGAIEEFGWTRQEAVLLTSFKFYVSAVAALIVGRLLDVLNPKHVIAVSALLGALAMVGFMAADRLPVYYALGVLLGLNGTGMAVSVNVVVSRAFDKSTGTMLGIVLSGTSVAGMILPMMMAPMMIAIGWRPAMAVLSCGIWVFALPGWLILSRRGSPIHARLQKQSYSAAKSGIWNHIKKLSVTRDFWLIFVGIFLVMGVDQSVLQNQVLFLESEKGLNLELVAWGAALLAGVGILAKILFGLLFDRLSILGIIICYLLLAFSVGLSFTVGGVATMLIFMTVRGIAHGGLIISGTVLLKHRYGFQRNQSGYSHARYKYRIRILPFIHGEYGRQIRQLFRSVCFGNGCCVRRGYSALPREAGETYGNHRTFQTVGLTKGRDSAAPNIQ